MAGVLPLYAGMTALSEYGDVFHKGQSLTDRSAGAVRNLDLALSSPLGYATHADLPGPFLVNSAVEAGWIGVAFLLIFLAKTASQLDLLNRRLGSERAVRTGILVFLGALSTVMVFNDYQMSNYAGLLLLGLLYRMFRIRNDEHTQTHGVPGAVAA
jgi:hypothetical protein